MVKVELHPRVVSYLRHCCTQEEVVDFHRVRDMVRRAPLKNSEPIADPSVSRYILRFFRFGTGIEKIALFEYDIGADRIRVRECRALRPRRRRDQHGSAAGSAPGPSADAPD